MITATVRIRASQKKRVRPARGEEAGSVLRADSVVSYREGGGPVWAGTVAARRIVMKILTIGKGSQATSNRIGLKGQTKFHLPR